MRWSSHYNSEGERCEYTGTNVLGQEHCPAGCRKAEQFEPEGDFFDDGELPDLG